jgi:putative ABC transport system permease protein
VLSPILSDVRFAWRSMRKSAGFFVVLAIVCGGGIGATTAMFSVVQAIVRHAAPFSDADQLVMLWTRPPGGGRMPLSLPEYFDWKERSATLSQLAVVHTWLLSVTFAEQRPEPLIGSFVSGEFFPTLGVRPTLGRLLGPEDERIDGPPVIVISADTWRRHFGGDPAVVGRTLVFDARPFTVVGVAPEGFVFSFPGNESVHAWIPMVFMPWYAENAASSVVRDWYAFGRRQASAELASVQAELARFANEESRAGRAKSATDPASLEAVGGTGVEVAALPSAVVEEALEGLLLRFVAIGLVFAVVCANVASLLLTRWLGRRTELATRAALGATRGQLVRQVLVESTLPLVCALPFALVIAQALTRWFGDASLSDSSPLAWVDVGVDRTGFAFCLLLVLASGFAVGIIPALSASRADLRALLEESGAHAPSGAQFRVRAAMVVVQVTVAFALLTGSGLVLVAADRLLRTPVGCDPRNVIGMRLLGEERRTSPSELGDFYAAVMSAVASLPGVEGVSFNEAPPLSGTVEKYPIEVEGRAGGPTASLLIDRNVVTPSYFGVMQIPLRAGRLFDESDTGTQASSIIVSERVVKELFPDQNPIGRRIRYAMHDDEGYRTIVGVVGDVRRNGLAAPFAAEAYSPSPHDLYGGKVVLLRARDPERALRELPAAVASVDPRVAALPTRLQARFERSVEDVVQMAHVLRIFSAIALLLATLGVYGLVSYSMQQKTREIGIRSALGSPPLELAWVVAREGLAPLALGLGLGALAAPVLGHALAPHIPLLPIFDLSVFIIVASALGGAGLLAAIIVARRALQISPLYALRFE